MIFPFATTHTISTGLIIGCLFAILLLIALATA